MDRIYLDYNSTTPVDPAVLNKMIPFFNQHHGNASSNTHIYGKEARSHVDNAKSILAKGINCHPEEIIITSGATESLNLAIKGLVYASGQEDKHIITLKTEHKAVLDTCEYISRLGVDIDLLSVNSEGLVDLDDLEKSIKESTILVAILHGNNEIGVINPIDKIGEICKNRNVPFLVDAAQTFGKIPINVKESGISMLVGSAHKIYGPKGVGFLYKHRGIMLEPLIHGGGHEMGLRSGTLNIPGIVGLAAAYRLMFENQDYENNKLKEHAKLFIKKLKDSDINFAINGPVNKRLPGNLNICLKGIDADWLITMIPNIAIARGSACTSETIQPSHVLRSIGISDEDANSSIRISFGRFTTENEVKKAANIIVEQSKIYLSKRKALAI
jgi:cysteine desulfurase